jgi:predicted esterase
MKTILFFSLLLCFSSLSYAKKISAEACAIEKGTFIFAGGECIEYVEIEGERKEMITIIVHGTWKEHTDTLARYAPFAETINMATDITTIAIALPGYSHSSTNHLQALSHKGSKNLAETKAYLLFLGELITALKKKYQAKTVNYIGHSAGAMMGAALTGMKPSLINRIALAGGKYTTDHTSKTEELFSINTYIARVDKKTKYLLIYGTEDKISKPQATKDFYTLAKKQGLDVTLVEVKGAAHLDLDMTDTSVEAIEKILE